MWPFAVHDFYLSVIEPACERHWFKDHEYGFPLIEEKDVRLVDGQEAFFIDCRFADGMRFAVLQVVEEVCNNLGVAAHYTLEQKTEYGLPFLEFQWIVCLDFSAERVRLTDI